MGGHGWARAQQWRSQKFVLGYKIFLGGINLQYSRSIAVLASFLPHKKFTWTDFWGIYTHIPPSLHPWCPAYTYLGYDGFWDLHKFDECLGIGVEVHVLAADCVCIYLASEGEATPPPPVPTLPSNPSYATGRGSKIERYIR